MSHYILKSALVGALFFASPASAATFINTGDSASIIFDGSQPGTSANLLLTLTGENSLTNIFTFSYTFQNTSNAALNPTVRVSSFGFNDNTNFEPAGALTDATGIFDEVSFKNNNFPNTLGDRDVCVNTKNCLGGNDGVTVAMGPVIGSLILDYTGSGLTQITLDNFAVRYISTGMNGQGSGTGVGIEIPGAVPEPATWMMLLIGMAGVGFSMRRKKDTALRVRFA